MNVQELPPDCRNAAYGCMAECCCHSAAQVAMVATKSALGRLLIKVQAEEPARAEKGLAILLACALGRLQRFAWSIWQCQKLDAVTKHALQPLCCNMYRRPSCAVANCTHCPRLSSAFNSLAVLRRNHCLPV